MRVVGGGRDIMQRTAILVGVLAVLWALVAPGGLWAAEDQAKRDDRPERGIGIYTDYSGVVVPVGEGVRRIVWKTLRVQRRADEEHDPSIRAELLLLSPSFLVPCLTHDGIKVWDTLAIAEYLNEILPDGVDPLDIRDDFDWLEPIVELDPQQVETEVSDKIEEAVNPISGVKHVQSVSREGLSSVIVEFNLEVRVNDVSQEARAKINAIRRELPETMKEPVIQKLVEGMAKRPYFWSAG
mgnify:CR=1 FL=1